MKKILQWIWLIPLFLLTSTGIFAEETIRITIGEWAPYLSKDLKHYGVAARIVTESFALEGVKVEYGFFPWARSKFLAQEGEWDGSAVWIHNAERAKDFLFSDSVVEAKNVFFHLENYSFDWNTIDDLKEIPIGGTIEYSYGEAFQNAEKTGKIKVQRAPSDEINFRKLLAGRIKIFPCVLDNSYHLLQKRFKPGEIQLITYHPKAVNAIANHLILSKKIERNKHMLILFNKGLKRLKESGKYNQYLEESRRGEYLKK